MKSKLTVTADNGVPYCVVIVRKGDKHGRDDCLTHDKDESLVEFYDRRYDHTENGQFVSSYYVSTIAYGANGIDLCGHVPDWKMDANCLHVVRHWLQWECRQELESTKPIGYVEW